MYMDVGGGHSLTNVRMFLGIEFTDVCFNYLLVNRKKNKIKGFTHRKKKWKTSSRNKHPSPTKKKP